MKDVKEMLKKVFGIKELSPEEIKAMKIQIVCAMLDEDDSLRAVIKTYLT